MPNVTRKSYREGVGSFSNAIWKLTVSATGGTFKIKIGAAETAAIAYNVAHGTLETTIEGLAGITAVEVTGGPGAAGGLTPYYIVFQIPARTRIVMHVSDNSLTGSDATAILEQFTPGGPVNGTAGLIELTANTHYAFKDQAGNWAGACPCVLFNRTASPLYYKVNEIPAPYDTHKGLVACTTTDYHGVLEATSYLDISFNQVLVKNFVVSAGTFQAATGWSVQAWLEGYDYGA